MDDRHATGEWGEKVAARALRRRKMKILGKRVHVGRHDEIDIVARDGDLLVFVEVKTRRSEVFGRPADSVDAHKRRTLSRAAMAYLRELKHPSVSIRFDIVEVVGERGDRKPEVRHIENAFPLDSRYRLPG